MNLSYARIFAYSYHMISYVVKKNTCKFVHAFQDFEKMLIVQKESKNKDSY